MVHEEADGLVAFKPGPAMLVTFDLMEDQEAVSVSNRHFSFTLGENQFTWRMFNILAEELQFGQPIE